MTNNNSSAKSCCRDVNQQGLLEKTNISFFALESITFMHLSDSDRMVLCWWKLQSRADLVIEIPRIPLVVLIAAVFGRWLLSLCVISHVMLKYTGERHGRQHADHRSQGQHQAHHHTSKIHRTDGIKGHWWAGGREGGVTKRRWEGRKCECAYVRRRH